MIDQFAGRTKLGEKLERFAKRHLAGKVTANQLTVLGLVLGILSAGILALGHIMAAQEWMVYIAASLTMCSFFVDLLDGAVARVTVPTPFGGILDIFCDRLVEVALIIAVATTDPPVLLWPATISLAAIVSCITIFLLVGGIVNAQKLEPSKKALYYQKGIMERGETFLFLLCIVLIPPARLVLLWVFAALVYATAFQRLWIAYKLFENPRENAIVQVEAE